MLKEFEAVAKRLEADFEEAKEYQHQGLKGLIREQAIVKTFLGRYLPKRYAIGSGQISDSSGRLSKQQDVVVYDGLNSPLLQDHEGAQLFFAEQVLTTLEVKSWLDKASIRAVLENSYSVGQLDRRSSGLVTLASGFKVRSISYPIVSFGVAYTSPLSLDGIRDEVYAYTSQASHSLWPTALLVLQDRNQQSGLIITVDSNNLRQILLFPQKDSRIASIPTPTKGVALLNFFLLLLQRLEIGGLASPSPDYLAYAQQSGLGKVDLSISNEALRGTGVDFEGQPIKVDDAMKVKRLQEKLNSNTSISDHEILDLYGTAIRFPNIDAGFRTGTVFVIGDAPWTKVSPERVGQALNRLQLGAQTEEDVTALSLFTDLIRSIQTSSRSLSIIDMHTGERHFLWVGPALRQSVSSI